MQLFELFHRWNHEYLKKKIINLCCHDFSDNDFHIKIIGKFVDKIDIVVQINWIICVCEKTTNNQFSKINCIITNICIIIKFMWFYIKQYSKIKHVFFVFCDNHELQLILKNILNFFFRENRTKNAIYCQLFSRIFQKNNCVVKIANKNELMLKLKFRKIMKIKNLKILKI